MEAELFHKMVDGKCEEMNAPTVHHTVVTVLILHFVEKQYYVNFSHS